MLFQTAFIQENLHDITITYTQYEGHNFANHKHRKLGVFGRKLGENHSPFYCFSDKYLCFKMLSPAIVQIQYVSKL